MIDPPKDDCQQGAPLAALTRDPRGPNYGKESSSLCDCSCLYDVDYEIAGLAGGTWLISIVGPYQPEGDPALEFLVDLRQASPGSHCVERTRYPWGS
jgi:hypothetical protein